MNINPLLLLAAAAAVLLLKKSPAAGTTLPATGGPVTPEDEILTALGPTRTSTTPQSYEMPATEVQSSPAAGNLPLVVSAGLPKVTVGIPATTSYADVIPYVTSGTSPLITSAPPSAPVMTVTPPPIPVVVVSPTPVPVAPTIVVPTVKPPAVLVPAPSASAPKGWVYGSDIAGTWGGFVPNGSFTDYRIDWVMDKAQTIIGFHISASSAGAWSTRDPKLFAVVVWKNGQNMNSAYLDNLNVTVQPGDIITLGFEGSTLSNFNGTFTVSMDSNLGAFPYTFSKVGATPVPTPVAVINAPVPQLVVSTSPSVAPVLTITPPAVPVSVISPMPVPIVPTVVVPTVTPPATPTPPPSASAPMGWVFGSDIAGTWHGFVPNGSFTDYKIDWRMDKAMTINDVYVSVANGYWSTSNPSAYAAVLLLNGRKINSAYTSNLNLAVQANDVLTIGIDAAHLAGTLSVITVKLTTSAGVISYNFNKA